MAWTIPPTFVATDVLTAAQQNILSDDISYLSNGRPKYGAVYNHTTDYTSSSGTVDAVDSTNLAYTQTILSGAVLTGYDVWVKTSANGVCLDITVDGTRIGASYNYGLFLTQSTTFVYTHFATLITGLSVASHVFQLVWFRTDVATRTMAASAASGGANFWVVEVG